MSEQVSNREPPVGYKEEWDNTTWNAGFIFRWSEIHKSWTDMRMIVTVKPGQTLAEAYEDRIDEPMQDVYTIFFAIEREE